MESWVGTVAQAQITSPQDAEAGESEAQGHSQLCSKFKASPGYRRLSQNKQTQSNRILNQIKRMRTFQGRPEGLLSRTSLLHQMALPILLGLAPDSVHPWHFLPPTALCQGA